jgi:hypothetical protein
MASPIVQSTEINKYMYNDWGYKLNMSRTEIRTYLDIKKLGYSCSFHI